MTGLYRQTLRTVYSSQFSFFIVALATPYGNYVMLVRTYITQFLSLWWLSVVDILVTFRTTLRVQLFYPTYQSRDLWSSIICSYRCPSALL